MSKPAAFDIPYTRFLDPEGRAIVPVPAFAQDASALIPDYRAMVLTRTYDAKAIALQRTGRLGTYASCLGQEAGSVGFGSVMQPGDVLLPTYREPGAQLLHGVTLVEMFLCWGGDERGHDFAGPREDFPVCIPVATQAPHATGVALAFKLRGEARAVVCCFGDGATSKGDIYEALNLAGVWQLPVLFMITNNQWAISVPREAQTATATLAQKAFAAGIPAEQVDGNDLIAMRHAAGQALEKARAGGGPHVIEALTYRLGDHTTADDATRYRDDESVSRHWKEEPIARLRRYLADAGVWTKDDEEALIAACAKEVDAAAETYLATPPEPPEAMFDHLYATLPPSLAKQRAALIEEAAALIAEAKGDA